MNLESKDLLVNNKQSCTKDIRSFFIQSHFTEITVREIMNWQNKSSTLFIR